jgi:diaminohydroxyphosphoribosylaminopyrimidine deaminase/5-amino-6-(5-phosphoribosylamino)uracil reductase
VTPGLRRALRAARRGVGWAAPALAWGVDLHPPGSAPITTHRRSPEDDPLARALAGADLRGARLSLTSPPPEPGVWTNLLASPLAEIDVGLHLPPEVGPPAGPRVCGGLAVDPVVRLNRGPLHRAATGRPLVLLKAATSLDGRTATRTGASRWITGPRARGWGRTLRGEVDAIVVGAQTVAADDPQLTGRRAGARDPVRVVFDSGLRTSTSAVVVRTARTVPTWLLTTPDAAGSDRATALRSAGVRVEALPLDGAGRPDVRAAVERFAAAGWTAVLVEGGATLAGSFVDADRVDYVTWFVAPLLLGGEGARPAIGGLGAPTPAAGLALEGVRTRRLGPDVLIEGWVRGRRPLV